MWIEWWWRRRKRSLLLMLLMLLMLMVLLMLMLVDDAHPPVHRAMCESVWWHADVLRRMLWMTLWCVQSADAPRLRRVTYIC